VKVGSLLLGIVLLAAALTQPAFAKEHRARGGGPTAPSMTKASGAEDGSSRGSQAKEKIDTDIAAPPSQPAFSADKARDLNASVKRNAPGDFQVRRTPVPGLSEPAARNSIGVAVIPRQIMTPSGGAHLGSAPQMPVAALSGTPASSSEGVGGSNLEREKLPTAPARIPGRGKIDGSGLIRPTLAPSGLGGPAKVAAGIDGTAVRRKR
jgi:hypothetical protein